MKRLSLLLLLTVVLAAAILGPARLAALGQTALYSTAREAARFWAYRSLRDNLVYEGTGYRIYFEPADEEVVGLVAQTIEKYRGRLSEMLRAQLPEVTVVIHPDQASLAKALGWEHERNAVGVYWAGLIRVLSPKAYIADPLSLGGRRTFERQGPMVHELTHLIMDYYSAGNYPRWFTEGVAQYVERELTGYEWISPRVDLTLERYSLRELTTAFDRLTDQALAYRQSLSLVTLMVDRIGEEGLARILARLGQGHPFQQVLAEEIGLSGQSLEEAWTRWLLEETG